MDKWRDFILGALGILGSAGILKLIFFKQEAKKQDTETKGMELNNNSLIVDQSERLLKLMEEQMTNSIKFYENEVSSVRKSNEEKKVIIQQKDEEIREKDTLIARLRAENAEKDKTIAVQKERECIRVECSKRLIEGEGDPATFQD